MDSLVNYSSEEDQDSENYDRKRDESSTTKSSFRSTFREVAITHSSEQPAISRQVYKRDASGNKRSTDDTNYDNVQMDMSEDDSTDEKEFMLNKNGKNYESKSKSSSSHNKRNYSPDKNQQLTKKMTSLMDLKLEKPSQLSRRDKDSRDHKGRDRKDRNDRDRNDKYRDRDRDNDRKDNKERDKDKYHRRDRDDNRRDRDREKDKVRERDRDRERDRTDKDRYHHSHRSSSKERRRRSNSKDKDKREKKRDVRSKSRSRSRDRISLSSSSSYNRSSSSSALSATTSVTTATLSESVTTTTTTAAATTGPRLAASVSVSTTMPNTNSTPITSSTSKITNFINLPPIRNDRHHFNRVQQLEKMGIDLMNKAKKPDGIELPSYYNPGVINPTKYAEQVQKRKLLWSNKKGENVDQAAAKWETAKFSQDQDGKVASKFMRLMGIKDGPKGNPSAAVTGCSGNHGSGTTGNSGAVGTDLVKKQEELFSTMEQQYEVARQVTHTMRGVGLGFGSQPRQF